MFSRAESKQLRQDFWIAFGKSYPRKWILYNTKIKGLSLKFHFDLKKAMVSIDIDSNDLAHRMALWEKLLSLKSILIEDFLSDAEFHDSLVLDNQKEISRIFVKKERVSIHNKNTWQETMVFLKEKMDFFERFFETYQDILRD